MSIKEMREAYERGVDLWLNQDGFHGEELDNWLIKQEIDVLKYTAQVFFAAGQRPLVERVGLVLAAKEAVEGGLSPEKYN